MKILNASFQTALSAESSAIAWCWLIERSDGIKLGFTSFDLILPIDSVPYEPFTGFTPTADSNSQGLEKNNSQELYGLFSSEQVSAADLLSGKFDKAIVTCFLVDVTDLPNTLNDSPASFLLVSQRQVKGISQSDLGFNLQTRDDDWKLEASIGKQTSKFCSHNLGDANCRVDLTNYTFTETVTNAANRYQFEISGSFTPGQFDRGKITFVTGGNALISRDVAKFETGNKIALWQPLPYAIAIGDEVAITQGCGKTLFDCITRYNNAINHGGEPHIPTTDQAIYMPIDNAPFSSSVSSSPTTPSSGTGG